MQVNNYNRFPIVFHGNLISNRRISKKFRKPDSLIGQVVKLDEKSIRELSESKASTPEAALMKKKILSICGDQKGAVVIGEKCNYIPSPYESNRYAIVAKFFTREEKIKMNGVKEEEPQIKELRIKEGLSYKDAQEELEQREDILYKPGVVRELIPIELLDWIKKATLEEMKMVELKPHDIVLSENWMIKPIGELN